VNWKEFKKDCCTLAERIPLSTFTGLYGIPTGGCFVAQELGSILNLPVVDSPGEHILVVDDIIHSGKTMLKYKEYSIATLFVNEVSPFMPDYYLNKVREWVNFPWEKTTLGSFETIEDNIVRILEAIGENPNRPGLVGTPSRIAKMYKEIFKGYSTLKPDLTVFENGADGVTYDELLFDTGSFVSWCEHHMLPFRGKFYIGYIPDKKISGLSKFARVVDHYSSRLQIQERLVKQVADELEMMLHPKGLGVMLTASHLCKEIRGIKNEGKFTTSDLRGAFRDNQKVKEEFLTLVSISMI